MNENIIEYIPLDKSWIIRMGVLDLLNGYDDTIEFLKKQYILNDDLQHLLIASQQWKESEYIDIGESATLYRFLKFASWKLNLYKKFRLKGTLQERKICDNKYILNWSLKELLTLDNGTSQWASISVLMGNEERLPEMPFKLKITYEALEHWTARRKEGKQWQPRHDETILYQARTFLEIIEHGKTSWYPKQAEDYCFARALGFITMEEGDERWPNLHGHESDRIVEMEKYMNDFNGLKRVDSRDHRVVQALAMLSSLKNKKIDFSYPDCVKKSWPRFWEFLSNYKRL